MKRNEIIWFIFFQQNIQTPAIHIILGVGIIGSFLLAKYWDYTSFVFGTEHSTALLAFMFVNSLVDCTTSLLYIPYLSRFHPKFVFPLFIGEGLSGLIPSILSLIQGSGDDYGDQDSLNFSVSTYFIILAALLAISWIAFGLLSVESLTREYRRNSLEPGECTPIVRRNFDSHPSDGSKSSQADKGVESQSPRLGNTYDSQTGVTTHGIEIQIHHRLSGSQITYLLALQAFISCLANSVLSSLQSYTAKPYGQVAYHLACNLALFASPSASLLAFLFDFPVKKSQSDASSTSETNAEPVPNGSSMMNTLNKSGRDLRMLCICVSGVVQTVCAVYLLILAVLHQNIPAADTWYGPTMMILAWTSFSFFASFCKTLICSVLRTQGAPDSLFRYGIFTQVGSLAGAIPTFIITNFTDFFK